MLTTRPFQPAVSSMRLTGTTLALSGALALALQAGVPALAGEIASPAVADDATPLGSIASGSFVSTQASDDVAEELREMVTGGKPGSRQSLLDHSWRFDVAGGNNYALAVEAWHTPKCRARRLPLLVLARRPELRAAPHGDRRRRHRHRADREPSRRRLRHRVHPGRGH
jgi:hypothetical protein